MALQVCPACGRHARESTCPFCGTAIAPIVAMALPRVARIALVGLGVAALASTACATMYGGPSIDTSSDASNDAAYDAPIDTGFEDSTASDADSDGMGD